MLKFFFQPKNWIFVLIFSTTIAQNTHFTPRYDAVTKGEVILIGNNILNRKAFLSNANKEYNEANKNASDFTMEYINVDANDQNFSSSSAYLTLNTFEKVKVRYAGLYWSATYPYAEGKQVSGKFIAEKNTRDSFDAIKIKLPNTREYQQIIGEILSDDYEEYPEKPYLVYADITTLLQKNDNFQGEYTIANVRATLGELQNGSSAGWALVVVYEKESSPWQKITLFDGVTQLQTIDKNLVFSGIQTASSGNFTLFGVGLGAKKNQGNNAFFWENNQSTHSLKTPFRTENQFLNSSITEEDEVIYSRKPASLNTLGWDIFSKNIASEKTLSGTINVKFTSQQSGIYLLALGISVPVLTPDSEQVYKEISLSETPKIIAKETENTLQNITSAAQKNISEKIEKKEEILPEKTTISTTTSSEKNVRKQVVANVKSGFYTILGVYSSESNVQNFIKSLQEKGLSAHSFFNPEKKLFYVYESYNESYAEAEIKQESIRDLKTTDEKFRDLKETWILKVETPEN